MAAMRYTTRPAKRKWPKRLLIIVAILAVLVAGATVITRHYYFENLRPVSSMTQKEQLTTIEKGATLEQIAMQLQEAGLIRSAWAFKLFVGSKEARESLQAGTYSLSPSQSVAEIVAQLTHGKVTTDLVTILPGKRLDQIHTALVNDGFTSSEVDEALKASNYKDNPALVDKPARASLEGYLYPDSFQKDANTTAKELVEESLKQMDKQLTPDLRSAFATQGLSTYQAITLASIVEQEVSHQSDRSQAAQVFLKRLRTGSRLDSDVTAYYGARLAGHKGELLYDTPYNTRLHQGLPPTPISNVSASSLQAVAHPASTNWLYFVAGDDGVTHFSSTLAEHEAAVAQYCRKLCRE